MENRERDRVSQRTTPTEAGQLNRQTEEQKGIRENSGTSAEFGQSIGRSENLSEGGETTMNRDRSNEDMNEDMNSNAGMGNESSRRSDQGSSMGSSSGRKSGSTGDKSDLNRGEQPGGRNSGSSGIGDSSSGRH